MLKTHLESFLNQRLKRSQNESIVDILTLVTESQENFRKQAPIEDIFNVDHEFYTRPRRSTSTKKGEVKIIEFREITYS
ncbi:hypothetical protein OnM2_004030 [Erysiphe neolycopersici]|uniref:Uncharacterized protein n=1 Tax=Erysiphe neolycopersici TaxID=212602 RepID=A0A420I7L1_9PEZI|nr:hypothetical protein OnM2_004030 [Erysiphe neolycopersici]